MSGRLPGLCVSYVWQITWTLCELCLADYLDCVCIMSGRLPGLCELYVWFLLCGMAGPSGRLPGLYVLYLADYLDCMSFMSGRLS